MSPTPNSVTADLQQANADLQRQLAEARAERDESEAQKAAIAEVLGVINSSPGDLAAVFEAMLEKATRLCEAVLGTLATYDGEFFRFVAAHGEARMVEEQQARGPLPPSFGVTWPRLLRGDSVVHVNDVRDTDLYRAGHRGARWFVDIDGGRSLLTVALRKGDALLGALTVYLQEVRPFSQKQIALLQNFAAQAVIAMENARLITETREALDQQTATAEVLQVINGSPGDLTPVFDAILANASRLCDCVLGGMFLYENGGFRSVAMLNVTPEFAEIWRREANRPAPTTALARLVKIKQAVRIDDLTEYEGYAGGESLHVATVDVFGARTVLAVPMLKESELLGAIVVFRREPHSFTEKQLALVSSFASQAAIAIENARLLTETREALEQQTATAEILRVLSSSPTDVQPTFDAIAESAIRICGAVSGGVFRFDGSQIDVGTFFAPTQAEREAVRDVFPIPPSRGSTTARAILTGEAVHILDPAADPDFAHASLHQFGTTLSIPMLKDGNPLGAITVAHNKIEAFSDKQIELLKTFADQAVIAIENVRLFNELDQRTSDLEESLEYQTATSNVLRVISGSTFDIQPVFETIVTTAARLCDADTATISSREGDAYRVAATFAQSPEFDAFMRGRLLAANRGSTTGRTALEGRVVHIHDIASDPEWTMTEAVTLGQLRTVLGVPLLRKGGVIGVIALNRQRVQPFTERQVELVRTFADQAVIAIENTRLITETREALEQQTATAEILEVINRSPGNLAPVFEAILDKAHTLCGATLGSLFLFDGELSRATATHGYPDDVAQRLRQGVILSATPQLLEGARWVHNPDLRLVDNPTARTVSGRGGVRTNLMLPLRKDERLLGTISCNRQEVRPFSEKEIALLESFAAQAVIAMDNARLLGEIRQRQAELRVTFDNMGDGVAMFDGELRLAAWNRNFQYILDLPDAFLSERPSLAEYFRYLTARGEYPADLEAELSRGIAIPDHETRFERTRPDGRVIEVRRNAVPGGGCVLIYGDITERKRAEEQIRAARDTAERVLAELKTAQASLIHAEKMASLGQLTAGIAHEIKNPLNFVNNFAELSGELLQELRETTAPAVAVLGEDERAAVDEVVDMLRGNLEKIAEHGRRADGIVKSMLEHSRGVSGERRKVDLNALVDEALNLAYHGARAQDASFNITLERDLDHSVAPIELAPQEITRVLLNLFGNGFYAATKQARGNGEAAYRPTLQVSTRDLGDAVEVRVRDNGTGIPPEIRDQLFQPFFTTKPTGEGTGLGLSISWDIVTQQHGGSIEVDSEPGEFTEFTIRLPRSGQSAGSST